VPGLAARKPKHASIDSVSCAPAGGCVAGGAYLDASKRGHVFVISEQNGRWGHLTTIFSGKMARDGVSLVASERNGRWGKPARVPGLAALGTDATVTSISCPSATSCAVGGSYQLKSGASEVFVASKRGGHWGKAIEVPGFTRLNQEGAGDLTSMSCISAGNCVAGGDYAATADFQGGAFEAFVTSERSGRWGKAIEVPGIPGR
jgi:hypothetical protein